jgi:tetratricopeptide (TPR) repeat protein
MAIVYCGKGMVLVILKPMKSLVLVLLIGMLSGCLTPEVLTENRRIANIHQTIQLFTQELENPSLTPEEQVVLREQIAIFKADLSPDMMVQYLIDHITANPDDPFNSFYLYRAAMSYKDRGIFDSAELLFRRILHTLPDVTWQQHSIHFLSLQELIQLTENPFRQSEYLTKLIENFPNSIDLGQTYFRLARTLEAAGRHQDSFRAYEAFLRFPNSRIPGIPNAHFQVREKLAFHNSNKSWVRTDLDTLVSQVRTAIATKNGRSLLNLRAGVNFFTASWHQDRMDINARPDFNLLAFLYRDTRIQFSSNLEISAEGDEAFMRTWGWSPRIPTWFLYFRRIHYPADPLIHGSWEWAGIFLGETL